MRTAAGSPDVPDRPGGDILSRAVRITLGGTEYRLPVRSIRTNREWKAQLDGLTAAKVDAISMTEGSLSSVIENIVKVLEQDDIDRMIDLLISYDTAGVLPSKDQIEEMEPDASTEVIAACREVWRAASPLVDVSLRTIEGSIAELVAEAGSPPMSSPPRNTGGRRKRSKKN